MVSLTSLNLRFEAVKIKKNTTNIDKDFLKKVIAE